MQRQSSMQRVITGHCWWACAVNIQQCSASKLYICLYRYCTKHTDWVYILQAGPAIQDIAAWLKQINSCANVQTYIAIAKPALDANLNFAVLHCPKCKVMHIDIPNGIANIKY